MAVRYVCDRCGETDLGGKVSVGRFTLNLAVSQPHGTTGLPKFDGELCGMCVHQICEMIETAITSKRT